MNKLLLLFVGVTLFSCNKGQQELFDLYNVTFNFINDTDHIITIQGGCGFNKSETTNTLKISAGTTFSTTEKDRIIMRSDQPKVDDFDLFPASCFAIYGDSLKCDFGAFNGIRGIENYEERIAHSPTDFELTYRFTEKTMDEAGSCN
jgi:hypothetical protein